jgi:predicted dehydrogenase/threonine dehydrogenase-like Zn-dependent dehydrogenase
LKQILQNLRDGLIEVAEVPAPKTQPGQVLICTSVSLVSAGTERMLVEFGKSGIVSKARQQPDKVQQVLQKMRTDGVISTLDAVRTKLDQPVALGYCNVGHVLDAAGSSFRPGDRVVSNGKHAEIVCVPKNLCSRIPDDVPDEQATFTVLAAIGLQGIRLANPTLGECVVVAGLGLIGLLTVQILRAQGCRVMGTDINPARLELARRCGAEVVVNGGAGEDVLVAGESFSRGRGVDAVIITAATRSNEPVRQAALMCRKRGRIVLVGVTGLELSRADFYEKELTFQVSCSYGPGRYDPAYEQGGQDYPVGFVRWTEQRNFEAVLDMMASGRLDVEPLITHRFPLERAEEAYALLTSDQPSLGILLEYPGLERRKTGVSERRTVPLHHGIPIQCAGSVAFIGAGNYASRVLIPAFKAAGASLHTVVSRSGVSASHHGRKFGFAQATSDWQMPLAETAVDTMVVATRHNAHAAQVLAALRAGKHVFCEKPLCLTLADLDEIESEARARPGQKLMVGFNRRFATQVVKMTELLATIDEPKSFIVTVNPGEIPAGHWTQDKSEGGGRIVGEACHFVDLLRHLARAPIVRWHAAPLGQHPALKGIVDKVSLTVDFADGSVGTIHYLANGNRGFPKERLEVFCAGRVLQLDNFRRLRGWGWPRFSKMNLWRQDKGQFACVRAFVGAIRRGYSVPIPLDEVIEVSRVSILLQQAAEAGR